jgi:hypothetical protein
MLSDHRQHVATKSSEEDLPISPFKSRIIISKVVDATMAPEVILRIKIRRSKLRAQLLDEQK